MADNKDFAKRVSALRLERGLSKTALAKKLDVSTTCVWNWEEGNTYPRPGALMKVAKELRTTVDFLERGQKPASSDETAASPKNDLISDSPVKQTLADAIHAARVQIAELAGLDFGQVKIVLEYGS
jgi:transcriptional regulator with XRE-family HTH domain